MPTVFSLFLGLLCLSVASCAVESDLFPVQASDQNTASADMGMSRDTSPLMDQSSDLGDSESLPPMTRGPVVDDGTDVTVWRRVGKHAPDTMLTSEVDELFQGEILLFRGTKPDDQWRRTLQTTYPMITLKCRSPETKFELAFTVQTERSGQRIVRYSTEATRQETPGELLRLLSSEVLDDKVHQLDLNLAEEIESEGEQFAYIEDLRVKSLNLRLDDIRSRPAPKQTTLIDDGTELSSWEHYRSSSAGSRLTSVVDERFDSAILLFEGVFRMDWWRKSLRSRDPVVTMFFRTAPDNKAEIVFKVRTSRGERLMRYSNERAEMTSSTDLFYLLPLVYSNEEVHLLTLDLGADLAEVQDKLLLIEEIQVTGKSLRLDEIRTVR